MVRQALLGWMPRIGSSKAPSQWAHVTNVAHALSLSGRAVLEGTPDACGELYFVTDYPPRHMFDQLEPILEAVGVRLLPVAIPRPALSLAARLSCAATRCLRPVVELTPTLTPASVAHLCSEFTVSTDKAERLLGYRPRLTEEQAYAEAIAAARASAIRAGRR
jgi:3beta-hydroxy-delta5-steroid dehydrogenase/steroid delta-isomerase